MADKEQLKQQLKELLKENTEILFEIDYTGKFTNYLSVKVSFDGEQIAEASIDVDSLTEAQSQ